MRGAGATTPELKKNDDYSRVPLDAFVSSSSFFVFYGLYSNVYITPSSTYGWTSTIDMLSFVIKSANTFAHDADGLVGQAFVTPVVLEQAAT